ncbi:MAG TPA: TIGR03435 family protein [Bryobacteraceae bacterium]|nr:TIGR03435 family protein [Bryobacteraceae bacterium]
MIPSYLLPLAHHLWQTTLFAAAAGLLTLCFRKDRAPVRYGLWLAASLKFLLPFSLLMSLGSQLEWRRPAAAPTRSWTFVAYQISEPFGPRPARARVQAAVPSANPVPYILLCVWCCGMLTSMAPWWNRWRRVRAAVRTATPLPIGLPIPVLTSSLPLEPGIFGVFRPLLLLPQGLPDRLTRAQLDAVLAHEMCHLRRRDNLAAGLHMLVEAIFWFDPLVWWLESRLVEERERACDEEVLRQSHDPETYAEGILSVCKLYLSSPLACMPGVTGADLRKRIEAIMTQPALRKLTVAKTLLLASAGVASLAVPVVIGIADLPLARAQSASAPSPPAPPIRAEVVSVRRNTTEDQRSFGMFRGEPGGKLTIRGVPLYFIIARAYHVQIQSPRLSGGPDWIHSERYDIEAIAEKDAISADLPDAERTARMERLLQGILADRFHLKIVRQTREIPVYALVVGKGGPKLQKSKYEEKDCTATPAPGEEDPRCHAFNGGQGRGLHAKGATMQDTVDFVENWTDRPFLDKTGLQGLYAIETEGWIPLRPRMPSPAAPGATPSAEELAYSDPATPTIFQIFERLGLKMESQKAPIEIYVIDHVERPTEN